MITSRRPIKSASLPLDSAPTIAPIRPRAKEHEIASVEGPSVASEMQRTRRYSGLITEEHAAKRRDPSKEVNHSLKFPGGLVTAYKERRRRTNALDPGLQLQGLELRRLLMQLQQGFALDGMGSRAPLARQQS
jgi:hypothetical protein